LQDERDDCLTSSDDSAVPNEYGNSAQGDWRPERPFLSYRARCGRDREFDTEPLFNPVHPANPVMQLPLPLSLPLSLPSSCQSRQSWPSCLSSFSVASPRIEHLLDLIPDVLEVRARLAIRGTRNRRSRLALHRP
jgi:hypothetical protein